MYMPINKKRLVSQIGPFEKLVFVIVDVAGIDTLVHLPPTIAKETFD
jgi:hypothetical protein